MEKYTDEIQSVQKKNPAAQEPPEGAAEKAVRCRAEGTDTPPY